MKLPKLHIRDLFWLVLVAAMGCAWWVDRRRLASREADAILVAVEKEAENWRQYIRQMTAEP